MPLAFNRVWISNVAPWDCIPLLFNVTVIYMNANGVNGVVSLQCDSSAPVADKPAPGPNGTVTFTLSHAAAGSGHTIEARLKHGANTVSNHPVKPVGVGNPCGISISGAQDTYDGVPAVKTNDPLLGTFDKTLGNGIILLVEEPAKFVDGALQQPLVIFADPAQVDVQEGKWKHARIPNVKKGYHLRVILTKDGVVKGAVRGAFK